MLGLKSGSFVRTVSVLSLWVISLSQCLYFFIDQYSIHADWAAGAASTIADDKRIGMQGDGSPEWPHRTESSTSPGTVQGEAVPDGFCSVAAFLLLLLLGSIITFCIPWDYQDPSSWVSLVVQFLTSLSCGPSKTPCNTYLPSRNIPRQIYTAWWAVWS